MEHAGGASHLPRLVLARDGGGARRAAVVRDRPQAASRRSSASCATATPAAPPPLKREWAPRRGGLYVRFEPRLASSADLAPGARVASRQASRYLDLSPVSVLVDLEAGHRHVPGGAQRLEDEIEGVQDAKVGAAPAALLQAAREAAEKEAARDPRATPRGGARAARVPCRPRGGAAHRGRLPGRRPPRPHRGGARDPPPAPRGGRRARSTRRSWSWRWRRWSSPRAAAGASRLPVP